MSLAQKGLTGFLFSFSSSLIIQVVTLTGGLYMARIIGPEKFGLVGMLYVIFAVTGFLVSGGLGMALIREKTVSEEDKATVFYFNIFVSLFFYATLWFCAPLIADFYNHQELIVLVRLMGLDLLFGSLIIVQKNTLQRELKFKLISIIGVSTNLLVTLISVLLAYNGFGVYALAIKFFLTNFFSLIFLYSFNPWLPKGFINKESFKRLFSFGSNVVLLGIINNIFGNLNQVMIGKYFTAATVGFFTQGKMFKDNVTSILNDTVMNVTFPMLSKLQDDKIRLKNAYKRIVRMNSFTIFPAITILILSAEPLIIGLLGEKWRGSVVFLKILGISGYVMHLHSINLNVLKVCGKGKDYLHQGFFRNGLMLIGVLITINISVIAMAWAFVVGEFFQLFINVYYSNKYIKFTIKEQFEIMLPLILITLVMGVCVYIVGLYNFPWLLMKLVVMAITGVIIYLGLSIYFKIDAFTDFKDLMLKKIYNK